MDGYVSSTGEWAAVPFGKEYMVIHKGQQDKVFKTLDAAKDYIQSAKKKNGTKGIRTVKKAAKVKGLESFMQ
ncbi:hypothetical protein [Synechococcus phage DSL-LC03]|nr:hypothetical protein [Synechococcus phage DSL-LC03]